MTKTRLKQATLHISSILWVSELDLEDSAGLQYFPFTKSTSIISTAASEYIDCMVYSHLLSPNRDAENFLCNQNITKTFTSLSTAIAIIALLWYKQ